MYSSNFGVIEVASTRTTSAPGWAYVPDTGVNPAVAALQPTNRKRARNQGGALSGADLTARQEAKIRKDLDTLEKDTNRDIAVPAKPGSGRAANKSTPGVRKILQSQKTFANHLDDYAALLAQADNSPGLHANQHGSRPPAPSQHAKRPPQPNQHTKKNATAADTSAAASTKKTDSTSRSRSRRSTMAEPEPKPEAQVPGASEDIEMTDGPQADEESGPSILTSLDKIPPPTHPGDTDPLLVSVVPDLPTNEELRTLLAHPPLSYGQAKADWGTDDQNYPVRKFCDVCGYWGRVKCIKCGTRVCALECLEVHREGCLQRYGV